MRRGSPSRRAGLALRTSKRNSCGQRLQPTSLNRPGAASLTNAVSAKALCVTWLSQTSDLRRTVGRPAGHMFAGSLFLSLTHVLDVESNSLLDPLGQNPHRLGPAGAKPTPISLLPWGPWTGAPNSLARNPQTKKPTCPAYSSESVTSEMLKGSHLFASVIHASRKRA